MNVEARAQPGAVPGMSALEVAAGHPIGLEPELRLPAIELTPMAALVESVAEAVRRPPCCVAFSGGRDSSLVLAAAARAAAREGAPPPIALTVRFPSDASATEDEWQELVVEHLGVEQRVLEVTNELELVGPVARAELLRRGVLFPPNAHLIAPLLPHAARGSLLIGVGGDEFLGDHRWEQLNDLLGRRRCPRWRDARRAAVAALPGALRGPILGYRDRVGRPWLRPSASRRVQALEARSADEPVRFDRAVARTIRRSYFQLGLATLRRLGDLAGVSVEAPLADPRFVAALALAGGARGWGSRAATMRAVADGALPERLVARRGKAIFDTAFFGEASRRFAEEWSGGGVDTSLVDPEELRRAWLGLVQPFRTATLLQLAWLHDHSEEARRASGSYRPSAAVAGR